MGEVMQLELEDGSTFAAVVETDEATEDLLRSLGRLRITTEDSDVEGHAARAMLDVIVYGPDDVEGHAMTLKLPHPEAARELQRKLLAAGVVGVIIVGAATTAMWTPRSATGIATGAAAPIAAPAPISRGLQAERGADIVATPSIPKAPISRGLQAERGENVSAPLTAPISRGLQAERGADQVATVTPPKAPVSRGLQAERGADQVATPDVPATMSDHQGMRRE